MRVQSGGVLGGGGLGKDLLVVENLGEEGRDLGGQSI